MKIKKRGLLVIMASAIMLTAVTPAFAAETASEKEEVIYINLTAEGAVKDVYAVNIFGKGDVIDYGDYSNIKMLNTNDAVSRDGSKNTFSASADRTYYEGKMEEAAIPWSISIAYYLDGKQYTGDELAGKSGKLEIRFQVIENTSCGNSFFDSYALQASFTLDTGKCSNIVASDATIANIGSDKQLAYTILPGKGIDTSITADVSAFEMDAVKINGIPLSMDVEVDDAELMAQVTELLAAIETLDNGAGELKDGTSELQNGAENRLQDGANNLSQGAKALQNGAADLQSGGTQLNDGTDSLQNGAASLYSGVQSLNDGIDMVQEGLNNLNNQSAALTGGSAEITAALLLIQEQLNGVSAAEETISALVQGSSAIQNGIDSLTAGMADLQNNISFEAYKAVLGANGLDVDSLEARNTQMIEMLYGQITELGEAGQDTTQLESIVALLQGNSAAISGIDGYLAQLNGSIGALLNGAATLNESYALIDQGINDLAGTVGNMFMQMSALKGGMDELVTKYSELDDGINNYTEGVAEIVAGYSQVVTGAGDVLNGSKELKDGTTALYGKTGELLSGIASFYDATGTLKDGTGQLSDGVTDLLVGIADLNSGTGALKKGTEALHGETDGMDTEISDKIDAMLASITGEGAEIVSFVSEKNINTNSVQFVIQTDSIEIQKADMTAAAAPEPLTFWEKLLHLFGWY